MATPENSEPLELTVTKKMLLDLEAELLADCPDLDKHLVQLHCNLREFPDLINLLKDEEIATLYDATLRKAEIKLAPAKKKSTKPGAVLGAMSDDDLFGGMM